MTEFYRINIVDVWEFMFLNIEMWILKDQEKLMIKHYDITKLKNSWFLSDIFWEVIYFSSPAPIISLEFLNDTFPPPSLIFLWWSFTFPLMKSFQRKIGVSEIKHWQVERESGLDLRLSRNWLTPRLWVVKA